jgi:hypothetical protein
LAYYYSIDGVLVEIRLLDGLEYFSMRSWGALEQPDPPARPAIQMAGLVNSS